MHWIDWIIVILPLLGILFLACYSRRYVRDVADYLAAGRVAGRYVISVGDLQSGLGVITLIALCESEYQCGIAISFWSKLVIPLAIFMSLTGYVLYRYRQTRSLSMGQFLELRYNRPFRVVAAAVRTAAEMMTNAIGPAIAARFFIYFLGLPPSVELFGFECPTFALVVLMLLMLALLVIWPGGRISLLVTDAIQGLMSYPIFVIFTCFILSEVSWHADIAPVMFDRIPGESFLNPNDIHQLRDFNLFALIVTITASILNRGAWIGNDTSGSGRTPHEQKMAGILGAWRNGFASLMMTLLALFVFTIMNGDRFAEKASAIRKNLVRHVAEETIRDSETRSALIAGSTRLPPARHTVGKDAPYSRADNPDTHYLSEAKKSLNSAAEHRIAKEKLEPDSPEAEAIRGDGNALFQQFRTLYYQTMAPTLLRNVLPVGLTGVFMLLIVMLMLATDDSRIFNASSTLVQDVIMPLRKKPFRKTEHLLYLRLVSLAVCLFFFAASLFFTQLDFIMMFINIVCALWIGGAGPIMIGGLYTRWGNTTGAFCALIFGSGFALTGLVGQRMWASTIYPYLQSSGSLVYAESICASVTNLCSPLIVWELDPAKFPINSYELTFLAMLLGCAAYTGGSLLTFRKPYNLDRMLHRGSYAEEGESIPPTPWTWHNFHGKLIGITPEYTRGDRIIAWSVFFYSIVFQFLIAFVAVALWNLVSPWPVEWWSIYFFFTIVIVGLAVGSISTVWFLWGGARDLFRLFRDLGARKENPLDDGWVENSRTQTDQNTETPAEQNNQGK